jgi:MFS family permease
MINSSAVLGLAIGSLTAGNVITIGRRKAAIYAQIVAIVASLCCQYMTFPSLCLGRFLLGLAAGLLNIVMGKSLDETVPPKYSTMFGCQTNTFICISVFLAMIMGVLLPTHDLDFATD